MLIFELVWSYFVVNTCETFFKKRIWRTLVLFVGPLISLFWNIEDDYPAFQSQGRFLLRFTSGETPADLASMAAEPFDPHTCTCVQALVVLKPGSRVPHALTF